jgi:hypothetical protein
MALMPWMLTPFHVSLDRSLRKYPVFFHLDFGHFPRHQGVERMELLAGDYQDCGRIRKNFLRDGALQ